MIGLTLKHMRYFAALASHGHFGRAAAACAISQPALSLQIKELESLMGGELVERTSREIRLTTLGQDFLVRAQDILMRVEDVEALVRSSHGPLSGRLRIGVIPTIAPYLLPDIITALMTQYPDLDLEPREAVTQSLIDDLLASRLDLAVVALPVSEPSLREFALFEEDFLLVRPKAEEGNPAPSLTVLQTMQLLLLEEGHCFRDQALSFCELPPSKLGSVMEGSSLSTLVRMVGAGIGVTLIPEMALPFEMQSANVSVVKLATPSPSRSIGLIWRKTNPLGDQLLELGAIIRKAAEGRPSLPLIG